MKKKLMMVAVLLGALSLGACVDDNESASVTAIRDAQAQKQAALAEYYSAQAEAELIAANADAELKAAQARYQEALAAYQEAQTEQARFNLQKAQEEYNRYLEQANIEAQTALLKAQIELQKQQEIMNGLMDARLRELYSTYANEANVLVNLRSQLNQQNNLLAQYNANLIADQAVIEEQRLQYNNWIAEAQAQIDAYTNYEGYDETELYAQMIQLQNEVSYAWQNYYQKQTLRLDAVDAYNDALGTVNYIYVEDDDETALAYLKAIKTLSLYMSIPVEGVELYEFEVGDNTYKGYATKYLAPDEVDILAARQTLARDLREAEEDLGEEGVPATGTTPEVPATGLYWTLAYWQGELEREQDLDDPNQNYIDECTLQIALAEQEIDKQIDKIDQIEANQDAFEEAVTAVATEANVTAYETALEALKENEAVIAYANAYQVEEEAYATAQELDGELAVVSNLYYYSVDAAEQIAYWNVQKANWEAERDKLSTIDTDNLILQVESMIEQLNNQIAAQEEIVQIAKDNLDEALAALDEGEETPEEPAA